MMETIDLFVDDETGLPIRGDELQICKVEPQVDLDLDVEMELYEFISDQQRAVVAGGNSNEDFNLHLYESHNNEVGEGIDLVLQ